MPKYLPTVNLWDSAISTALHNGQLKLQSGQWVTCGDPKNKSRFISASRNSIHAKHPAGAVTATQRYLEYVRGQNEHQKALQERRQARQMRLEGI